MSRWVGLTGRAGAGKDYTFRALQKINSDFRRVSFADQLRYEIEKFLDVTPLFVLWQKPYSEELRRLLQWWGTDFRRAEDPDYWVHKAEKRALAIENNGSIPVFTDVRFQNEAALIWGYGGFVVRVEARESIREERLGTLLPEHASETNVDEIFATLRVVSEVDVSPYHGQVRAVAELSTIDHMEEVRESFA